MTAKHVHFTFSIIPAGLQVPLEADVNLHESHSYYVVRNFHVPGHKAGSILPDIRIKRAGEYWVHIDSEKETDLSRAVGTAIDQQMDLFNLKDVPASTDETETL